MKKHIGFSDFIVGGIFFIIYIVTYLCFDIARNDALVLWGNEG